MQVEARSAERPKIQTAIRSRSTSGNATNKYAEDVVAGRIIAGPMVRDAAARHLRDLETGRDRGLRFDQKAADHALSFFPDVLRLNGGQFEGIPFHPQPSQAFIVGSLFGWKRDDGTRRFRIAYVEEGKGNGKSPLAAGIGIFGMVADNEPRAEIYAAATKKDQAMVLFRDAVAMVDMSPALSRVLHKSGRDDKVWNLFHEKSNSFFRPISADDGQSGPRPHFGLIDELHEHRNGGVINMMAAGRKWRRQPLIFIITNSGHDRTSVCWEYHEMARQVCAGSMVDDTFFAYVCALDEGDDPFKDETCWIKANPLLGTIIDPQYLRDEVNQARGLPSKESQVRRLNFCEWTEAHNPAIPYDEWMACAAAYDIADFAGSTCYIGLDLSNTTDLTAAVLVFVRDGKKWWWPLFWLPKDGLQKKVKKDKVPYDVWEKKGLIRTTPGRVIDKDFVVADLNRVLQQHRIRVKELAYDRFGIEQFTSAMDRQSVSFELVPFGQGFVSMGPAVDSFEVDLLAGTMRHPNHPCLNFNAASAVAAEDSTGWRKLDKAKATGRIDGMVAGLMAHARSTLATPRVPPRIRFL